MPIRYYFPFSVTVTMDVVSFTATPAVVQMGSTVDSVVLRWQLSKDPLTLNVAGVDLANNTLQLLQTGPFTSNQVWKLVASDMEGTVARSKATLTFLNSMYYGVAMSAPTDSDSIRALGNTAFATAMATKLDVFHADDASLFYYAYPARFGLPRKITVLGPADPWPTIFDTFDFTKDWSSTNVSYTNESGFTEMYVVIAFTATLPQGSNIVEIK